MTYNPILSLILSLLIFLVVILLCLKDRKRETTASENENAEENNKGVDEIVDELDSRESFQYIIDRYFDKNFKESFFIIYKKLLDKVSDISMDPRCNSDDFEYYSDLTDEFFSFCIKCESYSFELFDYKHYGTIDISRLKSIKNLNENRVMFEVSIAERTLRSKCANRIFNNIDLNTVLSALVYYSFANPKEKEYAKVREFSQKVCKQNKIDFLMCDIYMEHQKQNKVQIRELIHKLLEKENMELNRVTVEELFSLASALNWMEEKEAEYLLLSSCYGKG